jgi:hypothetical protein
MAGDLSFFSGFLAATGLFSSIAGLIFLPGCARRLARLRVRLVGAPARGEVVGLEVHGDGAGSFVNSPQVRYFSPRGPAVVTHALGYRSRQLLPTGAQVRLWYDPLRPERILVSRFDLRPRDFVAFAAAAAAVALGVGLEIAAYALAG